MRRFDRASLGRQDQFTYDILLDQWETAASFKRFDWLSPKDFIQSARCAASGAVAEFLETQHVVKNAKTARNYVKRLEATGGKLDGVTGEMLWQAKLGVVLPISLLERASGIKDTVAAAPRTIRS